MSVFVAWHPQMSARTCYSIVKGITPGRANEIIAEATKVFPGPVPKESRWSDWTHVVEPERFQALVCSDVLVLTDDAWRLAQEISRILDSPYLELRIQEGDHWDFTLYHRARVVADFSTRVSYYSADATAPRPWRAGDAARFSACWGVPLDCIVPYLIDWESPSTLRLAREGDKHPAGDWCQIFDFMRAIGIEDPFDHPNAFEVVVPAWSGTYVVQPWWRRVVRRISVWIKDVYPDVPRPTAAQREEWNRRAASVRVVTMELDQALGEDEEQ